MKWQERHLNPNHNSVQNFMPLYPGRKFSSSLLCSSLLHIMLSGSGGCSEGAPGFNATPTRGGVDERGTAVN